MEGKIKVSVAYLVCVTIFMGVLAPLATASDMTDHCDQLGTYSDCTTFCPHTCDNLGAMIKCRAGCNEGYVCTDDMVLRTSDSSCCVRPEHCPPKPIN